MRTGHTPVTRAARRRRRYWTMRSGARAGSPAPVGGERGDASVGVARAVALLAHDVQRAVLDLVVDAPDVLADHAERDQLDAAEQQDGDRDRAEAGQVGADDAQHDHDRDRDERDARGEQSDVGGQLQRQVREGGDRVEREAQHLAQRVLGLAGVARVALVGDGGLREADPHGHAAQEARALGHRQQRVQRAAVEQAEVAGVGLEVDLGELVEQLVEPRGGGELEGGLALALLAHRVDDVGALAPLGDHLGDQLRRVLQVGVDHRDDVADRVLEAGGERGLVAEVAREVHDAHARVGRGDAVEQLGRAVGAAVVDEDQLELEVGDRGAGARARTPRRAPPRRRPARPR